MKFRAGFVSNSSSSSFCIYGVQFDSWTEAFCKLQTALELDTIVEKLKSIYSGEFEDYGQEITTFDELEDFISQFGIDTYELFEDLSSVISLHSGSEYDDGVVSFGREWSSVGDSETGAEFKASVETELTRLFGSGLQCSTIEESFRC